MIAQLVQSTTPPDEKGRWRMPPHFTSRALLIPGDPGAASRLPAPPAWGSGMSYYREADGA